MLLLKCTKRHDKTFNFFLFAARLTQSLPSFEHKSVSKTFFVKREGLLFRSFDVRKCVFKLKELLFLLSEAKAWSFLTYLQISL